MTKEGNNSNPSENLPDLTNSFETEQYLMDSMGPKDWNRRCDQIKAANSGVYPQWFGLISAFIKTQVIPRSQIWDKSK